jgi:hypothetical protein
MGNITDQPSGPVPNKRNGALAIASLILGILAFVLPCLAFFMLGFLFNETLIDAMGLYEFSLFNIYIPMALWIAGPIAIGLGILSLQKRQLEDASDRSKKIAKTGIGLGILTIPFVFLPLLLLLLFVYSCEQGC